MPQAGFLKCDSRYGCEAALALNVKAMPMQQLLDEGESAQLAAFLVLLQSKVGPPPLAYVDHL